STSSHARSKTIRAPGISSRGAPRCSRGSESTCLARDLGCLPVPGGSSPGAPTPSVLLTRLAAHAELPDRRVDCGDRAIAVQVGGFAAGFAIALQARLQIVDVLPQ